MNSPILLIGVTFLASVICCILPRSIRPLFALIASVFALVVSYNLFKLKNASWDLFGYENALKIDNLSAFVLLFIAFFGSLIILYSIGFLKGRNNINSYGMYYPYILAALAASVGAVLANNLLLFIGFWSFLGIILCLLIGLERGEANKAAKKTFIVMAGSVLLMIFGLAIIWKLTGAINMDTGAIPLNNYLAISAFMLLALGAFAKVGAVPLHTWIPDSAGVAPLPVMALLPGSLDKLLGIYFLARLTLGIFIVEVNSAMSLFLLIIGAITIIVTVVMVLVQHDMKRLLSYYTVNQVGYTILGIGTANPIGIAGGLFHMINSAVYNCALFLTAGAVEKKTGTTDLDKLGGIARFMPISFLSCLVASLAISGIPPLNGFASKWMIYQGIIELNNTGNKIWIIWLVIAMFGSTFTLASFMKLLHAVFLGQPGVSGRKGVKEVGLSMWLPMVILAFICIIFGIFAFGIPLKAFIIPIIGTEISYIGLWQPALATVLIFVGLAIGLLIYFAGTVRNVRVAEPFIGGETLK